MKHTFNIMVVEDDAGASKIIELELKARGYRTQSFTNAEEALVQFQKRGVDLVLVDYGLPGMNGEDFFKEILEINPLTPVIFITAMNSVKKAVQLIKMGAYSYLTKPLNIDDLHHNVESALGAPASTGGDGESQVELPESRALNGFVFKSDRMQKLLRLVTRVAVSESNILLTGESGTGKDVVAHIIHEFSRRKERPLVKVNLSALPETLIEAELFGAVKGAYTGSVADRRGKFEEASGGTLFLDEIGELLPEIQVKLLRVIQDREITRLGSNVPIKVDIRLVTATNMDLNESVREKNFREDLFYRLNVINIHMPPLRERAGEIPLLVDLFIKKFNRREGKRVRTMTRGALDALTGHTFPGNIRELENIIERALVLSENDVLGVDDLPLYIISRENFSPGSQLGDASLSLPERLIAVEKEILEATLKKHNYHQTNAARELGISEGCLRYKIRAMDIPRDRSQKKRS